MSYPNVTKFYGLKVKNLVDLQGKPYALVDEVQSMIQELNLGGTYLTQDNFNTFANGVAKLTGVAGLEATKDLSQGDYNVVVVEKDGLIDLSLIDTISDAEGEGSVVVVGADKKIDLSLIDTISAYVEGKSGQVVVTNAAGKVDASLLPEDYTTAEEVATILTEGTYLKNADVFTDGKIAAEKLAEDYTTAEEVSTILTEGTYLKNADVFTDGKIAADKLAEDYTTAEEVATILTEGTYLKNAEVFNAEGKIEAGKLAEDYTTAEEVATILTEGTYLKNAEVFNADGKIEAGKLAEDYTTEAEVRTILTTDEYLTKSDVFTDGVVTADKLDASVVLEDELATTLNGYVAQTEKATAGGEAAASKVVTATTAGYIAPSFIEDGSISASKLEQSYAVLTDGKVSKENLPADTIYANESGDIAYEQLGDRVVLTDASTGKIDTGVIDTGVTAGKVVVVGEDGKLATSLMPSIALGEDLGKYDDWAAFDAALQSEGGRKIVEHGDTVSIKGTEGYAVYFCANPASYTSAETLASAFIVLRPADGSVSVSDFNALQQKTDGHIETATIHVSEADRTAWLTKDKVAGDDKFITVTGDETTGNITVSFSEANLSVATAEKAGIVKPGKGVSVDENGVITVSTVWEKQSFPAELSEELVTVEGMTTVAYQYVEFEGIREIQIFDNEGEIIAGFNYVNGNSRIIFDADFDAATEATGWYLMVGPVKEVEQK